MRSMYHIEGMTDLAKMRDEAIRRSKDVRFGPPTPVVIHHHRASESCADETHEKYEEGVQVYN